eukprot:gene5058-6324_t
MKKPEKALSRRVLFAGAGTAGALAAIASVLPSPPAESQAAAEPKAPPTQGGGYSVSEHVQHYYKTTRI